MEAKNTLIQNGYIVNSKSISKSDILIKDGKTNSIGTLSESNLYHVIDATDKYIFPGIIALMPLINKL